MAEKNFLAPVTDPSKLKELGPYIKDGVIDLQALVIEIDTALIEEGAEPFQRPLGACARIASKLGISFAIGGKKDEFVEAVHLIYESLYRKDDLYMPPMHIGTVMFRDIFLPLKIPVIYGQVGVDPIKSLHGVPENTIKWIFGSDDTASTFTDQWIDLFDFVYGLDDVSKLETHTAQAIEFWQLAKQQLEGAAATLLGSIDKYTVIQNSIIAIELLLKGALLARGEPEASLKKFGHKMGDLVDKACELMPNADHDRLKLVVDRTPQLVERRYQAKDYKRTEIGQIMMDAQFVAGEVMRQFSDRDMRSGLTAESSEGRDYQERFYPPLSG
ncbi:MAG: hypothetical protein HQ495_02355 [Alphaproteobacteria bacterium]|nr:hypothetical protein [Alphaproteobacteria bacterium]